MYKRKAQGVTKYKLNEKFQKYQNVWEPSEEGTEREIYSFQSYFRKEDVTSAI